MSDERELEWKLGLRVGQRWRVRASDEALRFLWPLKSGDTLTVVSICHDFPLAPGLEGPAVCLKGPHAHGDGFVMRAPVLWEMCERAEGDEQA